MHPARQPVPNWAQLIPDDIRRTLQDALADPAYRALPTFRAQCVHLAALPGITPYYTGKFLGVAPKGVRRQLEKAYSPRKPAGRPPVLNDEQVTAVTAFIRQRWETHDPASVCDVLNFIWEQFEISVIPDPLRRWLNTRSEFKIARSRPMEDHRLQLSIRDIAAYFDLLTQAVAGVPSGLIFNLDEGGFQRFVDLKHSSIIVPRGSPHALHSTGEACHVSLDCRGRRNQPEASASRSASDNRGRALPRWVWAPELYHHPQRRRVYHAGSVRALRSRCADPSCFRAAS